MSEPRGTVAVVGAGIAGLAAAWALSDGPNAPRVMVLEAADRVGGKLAVQELDGHPVDVGAEAMLARRPEAMDLARQVGLGDDLVFPRPAGAWLWSAGARHPLPTGTVMGVPSRSDGLAELLGVAAAAAVVAEPTGAWPALDADTDVASFVAARVGPAVVERLVEPLLGGVYAGWAGELSLRATVPALWTAATEGGSVVRAAAAAARRGAATRDPVFAGLRGGVGRLPLVLAERLCTRGVAIRTGTTVRGVQARPGGWRLVLGPTNRPEALDVDAVLLATPAAPTARLLRDVAPVAAAELARVPYAGVGLVTLVLDRAGARGLSGTGVLVPPVDGRLIKAATFASAKWAWQDDARPGRVVVRASVGRHHQESDLHVDDDELVRRVLADLRALPGVTLPDPVASTVTRWGGGLPQYVVGHLDAMDRVHRQLTAVPGLALAGAAYEGVGIAACIVTGRRAAAQLLTHLGAHRARAGTLGE
jgi:protoporphyrinogen/coproporphyrinogen III oxidase